MGATVVSGVDAPPVFEVSEHIFDLMGFLSTMASCGIAVLRLAFEGMEAVMRRLAIAARNKSAS